MKESDYVATGIKNNVAKWYPFCNGIDLTNGYCQRLVANQIEIERGRKRQSNVEREEELC